MYLRSAVWKVAANKDNNKKKPIKGQPKRTRDHVGQDMWHTRYLLYYSSYSERKAPENEIQAII